MLLLSACDGIMVLQQRNSLLKGICIGSLTMAADVIGNAAGLLLYALAGSMCEAAAAVEGAASLPVCALAGSLCEDF